MPKPVEPRDLYVKLLQWLHREQKNQDPTSESAATHTREDQIDTTVQANPDATLSRLVDELDLDRVHGLSIYRGDSQRYLTLLSKLPTNHRDTTARIRACLSGGDSETPRQLAHALKGVAANLGVRMLAHTAAQLEKAFTKPDEVPSSQQETLMQKIDQMMDQLASVLQDK